MRGFPRTPAAEDADAECFGSGHLWLLEAVDGGDLRFQLSETGALRFGDGDRVYKNGAIPERHARAVRWVRERLDRAALAAAVADVESVVFFGRSTHRDRIDYEWERLPPFLGVDVWSAESGAFRPPGAAAAIFEGVGLDPVNAVERELHTRDFDPDGYGIPDSAWYDGPAAGVLVRNKAGGRALLPNRDLDADSEPAPESAAALVEARVTDDLLEGIAAEVRELGGAVTVEALVERTTEELFRRRGGAIGDGEIDLGDLRAALAERARAFLGG